MAIAFGKLNKNQLAPTDKLPIGKFRDCRICDIWDEDFEYLVWLHKQGLVQYNIETMQGILKRAGFHEEVVHYDNEIAPYLDEDVPF